RAPKTREKALDFSGWRYAIDRIEAEVRRAGHIKKVVETERKMISGDTRFERGVDKDLFVGADLENTAAPVADVKISVMIEGDTGGDTHPFRIQLCASRAIDAIDVAFIAARNKKFHPGSGRGGGRGC